MSHGDETMMTTKMVKTHTKIFALLLLLVLALLATACDGARMPQVIATYPQTDPPCPYVSPVEWPHPRDGWNPTVTFNAAFAVFARLFQVLIDGLIWAFVVAGPFVLMALGVLALLRRRSS